jgi:hypothetical protein
MPGPPLIQSEMKYFNLLSKIPSDVRTYTLLVLSHRFPLRLT